MAGEPPEPPQEPLDHPGSPYFFHTAPLTAAALPRSGRILAALDDSGSLTAWDCSSGQRLYVRAIFAPGNPPRSLICSPDSRLLAISSMTPSRPEVVILELATGKILRWLGRCFSPVFSPDGGIISGSDGPRIRRFRVLSGEELPPLEAGKPELLWVAASPDGMRLAATFRRGYGHLQWDLDKGTITETTDLDENAAAATALTFGPDGRSLWIATLWGVRSQKTLEDNDEILSGPPLQFTADGRWLISGFRRKLVRYLDPESGALACTLRLPLTASDSVDISDGGEFLIRSSGRGIVLENALPAPGAPKAAPPAGAVAYTLQGTVRVADVSGGLLHWDPRRRRELSRTKLAVPIASMSRDGRLGVSPGIDGDFRIWMLEENRELLRIGGLVDPRSWALSDDGARLAVATRDGDIAIWDVGQRKELARIRNEVHATALAWSRDARTIAWGDALGSVGFAEGGTGREALRFKARGAAITALAFLPDGKKVVSGDRRGVLLSWQDALGAEPVGIAALGEAVAVLESSPDGRWLAAASRSLLRLCDLQIPGPPVEFRGHRGPISSLAFSPGGTELLSGGDQPSALVWRVPQK